MNWTILIVAGLFEVAFASCLEKAKLSTGNVMYFWYTAFFLTCATSMLLLTRAVRTIPLGVAYTVWTGIGATGTVLMGILVFKDPVTFWKMFFLATLIGSIIGLKLVSH